jgi:hypothetical protein
MSISSDELQYTTPHVAAFDAAFAAENAQRELARIVRHASLQLSSSVAFLRMDGLKVLLRLLHDLAALPTPSGAPLDVVGASMFPTADAFAKSQSVQRWTYIHSGLKANVTSSIFHMIFPRRDLAMAMCGPSGPPIPTLDAKSALEWSTAVMANSKAGSGGVGLIGEVSLLEQELAMRLVQGLCIVVPAQKHYLPDSPLMPLVSEVMGLCLQHVQALRSSKHQSPSAAPGEASSGSSSAQAVAMDPALVAVLVAMVDAVEAACHYSPRVIAQVAQLGTVRHMLNLAACSATPTDLRCAIFDAVSFLMQEVAPFRRAVQQVQAAADMRGAAPPSSPLASPGGPPPTAEANLVMAMLDESLAPSQRRDAPPFLMDRASASKFDSAVRDWFSLHRLTSLVPALFQLRDVTGTAIPSGTAKHEMARYVQRSARQRERLFTEFLAAVDARSIAG